MDIPADGFFELNNAFQIYVSPTANSQYAQFQIAVTASLPIVLGASFTTSVLIHNGGVFVWEGVAGARNMSGAYLKTRLQAMGKSVTDGTVFPASFHSFEAVFLSFGTPGTNITRLNSSTMYFAIKDYLLNAGKLYIEGGDAVGYDLQTYFPAIEDGLDAHEILYPLLGIDSAEDGITNTITDLNGDSGWHTFGLQFIQSAQTSNTYIDTFEANVNGVAALRESEYGIVAIQNLGAYDQRSIVFSYVLRELADGVYPNTKAEFVNRIGDFFFSENLMLPDIQNLWIQPLDASTLRLGWDYPFPTDCFKVFSDNEIDGSFEELTAETQNNWQDVSIGAGTHYFFRVKAERAFGVTW